MTITNSTAIPAPIQTFYDRVLLERAIPYLAHHMFGQKRPVPMKMGDQPKFRRYNSLTQATAPLVEGVTPTAQALTKTEVTGQLVQYGSFVELTDYVQYVSQDPVLTETAEILGENSGESLDSIFRDTLVAGTSVLRANSVAARTDIITKVSEADLDKSVRALRTAKAKFWNTNPIAGTSRVGTTPIAASYFAICHPFVTYDLETLTDWVPVHKYPNPASALPNEVGSHKQIRFIESTNAKIWEDAGGTAVTNTLKYTTANSACDVYGILIFGKNAYGVTDLKGKGMENIVKPLGSGDDPLNQRSTSGWKSMTDILILQNAYMYRVEVGVSV